MGLNGFGNDFLVMTPKVYVTAKIDKWDYIKIQHLRASRDTINRVKRHLQNRRK